MVDRESPTIEEIRQTIKSARDSVWVITNTLEQLASGKTPNLNLKGDLQRNVGHLGNVVARSYIVESGEDISDLEAAIVVGKAELVKDIWPTAN